MTKFSPAFEGKVSELARLGAAEGYAVNILVRPVLCPLDDKAAAFSALMGAFVGQSFAAPSFSAAGDETPVGDIRERMKEGGECLCTDGRCACRTVAFGDNGASDAPETWMDRRNCSSGAGEPKFGEPMGFGIG